MNPSILSDVACFVGSRLLEIQLILNQFVVGLDKFFTGIHRNPGVVRQPAKLMTSFAPSTSLQEGVGKFVDWYRNYHDTHVYI